ncbi:hypothetical protein [Aneurinibacillus sp. REN35]|uniref:hypothetical protein n=1 Tax=Aneurinibacillus sp. REN35 TaxID=3237286 RepID=UPI003529607D
MNTNGKMVTIIEGLLIAAIVVYVISYSSGSLYLAVYTAMAVFIIGIAGIVITLMKQKYMLAIRNFGAIVALFVHIMFFWKI